VVGVVCPTDGELDDLEAEPWVVSGTVVAGVVDCWAGVPEKAWAARAANTPVAATPPAMAVRVTRDTRRSPASRRATGSGAMTPMVRPLRVRRLGGS